MTSLGTLEQHGAELVEKYSPLLNSSEMILHDSYKGPAGGDQAPLWRPAEHALMSASSPSLVHALHAPCLQGPLSRMNHLA